MQYLKYYAKFINWFFSSKNPHKTKFCPYKVVCLLYCVLTCFILYLFVPSCPNKTLSLIIYSCPNKINYILPIFALINLWGSVLVLKKRCPTINLVLLKLCPTYSCPNKTIILPIIVLSKLNFFLFLSYINYVLPIIVLSKLCSTYYCPK